MIRILIPFFIPVFIFGLLVQGCSKGYSKNMQLPEDSPSTGLSSWAVVTSAYAIARAEPDSAAASNGLVRKGTVFPAASRMIDRRGLDIGGTWYRCETGDVKGWIHSDELGIYDSEAQAREVAGLGAGLGPDLKAGTGIGEQR
jgi:hypothetical protein